MANLSSPSAVTIAVRKPVHSKFAVLAAAPILLLLFAMATLRLLPQEDEGDRPYRPHPGTSGPVRPAPQVRLDPVTQKELIRVVSGQLDAFRRDDYAAALRFSTTRFRESITPEGFRTMIRTQYPALANAVRSYFRTPGYTGDNASVFLVVQNENGRQAGYFYQLAKLEGRWSVVGCMPAPMFDSVMPGAPHLESMPHRPGGYPAMEASMPLH